MRSAECLQKGISNDESNDSRIGDSHDVPGVGHGRPRPADLLDRLVGDPRRARAVDVVVEPEPTLVGDEPLGLGGRGVGLGAGGHLGDRGGLAPAEVGAGERVGDRLVEHAPLVVGRALGRGHGRATARERGDEQGQADEAIHGYLHGGGAPAYQRAQRRCTRNALR